MGNITTTARETFTHEESCNLAWMIFRRFGRNLESAANAWRRLLQNTCQDHEFAELVDASPLNEKNKAAKDLSLTRQISLVLAVDRPRSLFTMLKASACFEGLVGGIMDELVALMDRVRGRQPATYMELEADDYAPFVERILKGEKLAGNDFPVWRAPESDQV